MFNPLHVWFDADGFAEEVIFLGCSQPSMAVGRTNHAELVGIRSELPLKQESVLQRLTRVFSVAQIPW